MFRMTGKAQTRSSGSRPKVLFVSYTADWTGPTNSLLLLVKHLRNRYDVAVLVPGQGLFSDSLASEGIPFFSLPGLTKRFIPAIYRLIRREHFDLVYGNTTHSSSRCAIAAAKFARVPFICHVRGLQTESPWLTRAVLNLADAVVAASRATADCLQSRVSESKLKVVYNGVDVGNFASAGEMVRVRLRQELGLNEGDLTLVKVAHLRPLKGQEYALQAMAQCTHNGLGINLLLVGHLNRDRRYVQQIRALRDQLGLNDKVRLLGFRQDVPALLSLADINIHTSSSEAHPRATLEAMATHQP